MDKALKVVIIMMLDRDMTAEQKANSFCAFPTRTQNKYEEKGFKFVHKKNYSGKTAILNKAYKND